MYRLLIGAVAACALLAAGPAAAQEKKITVWWGKGFYKAEDDALLDVIKKFEAKTGIKVELSQYAIQDMIPKTVAALDAGTVPDVAYSDSYDVQAQGKWAYEGKREDLSDILLPMKDAFAPNTLETAKIFARIHTPSPFPASHKRYMSGSRADLRAPYRQISLSPTRHGDRGNKPSTTSLRHVGSLHRSRRPN